MIGDNGEISALQVWAEIVNGAHNSQALLFHHSVILVSRCERTNSVRDYSYTKLSIRLQKNRANAAPACIGMLYGRCRFVEMTQGRIRCKGAFEGLKSLLALSRSGERDVCA